MNCFPTHLQRHRRPHANRSRPRSGHHWPALQHASRLPAQRSALVLQRPAALRLCAQRPLGGRQLRCRSHRLSGRHVPVPLDRRLHQLVLCVRRPAGLRRCLRRGVHGHRRETARGRHGGGRLVGVSARGVPLSDERPVRVAGGPVRWPEAVCARRGRDWLQFGEVGTVSRVESQTTGAVCTV